jgi:UDP-2,4-diacetamido-2,4,6-trideoxy-beta-L-altropyranose hydrolase
MNPLRVIFRSDASVHIGIGHVMRCLTLAEALRERGAKCQFICREYEGHLLEQIRQRGFHAYGLPVADKLADPTRSDAKQNSGQFVRLGLDWTTDAAQTKVSAARTVIDWLIVDHYALDAQWERALRPICRRLMVIDDLADRRHDCDVLLDQNFHRDQDQRYQELLPKQCKTLLGPAYVLLRSEFEKARQRLRMRDGIVKRLLVFFGGSDPKNQTQTVLTLLEKMNIPDVLIDVVVGHTNPNRRAIQEFCDRLPSVTYHCNVSNMAELIVNADLGIGAGGSAMWERCYLGLPTITVVFAENQVRTSEDVAQLGAIEYLGSTDSLGADDYERAISRLIANPQRLKQISDAALAVVQKQTTSSVVDEILNFQQQDSAIYPAHSTNHTFPALSN